MDLVIEKVSKRFGGVHALQDVAFDLTADISAVIGPNGAGKTTLFNIISGVFSPTEGTVSFNGKTITGLSLPEVMRLGISRTFQNLGIFPELTVWENLVMGLMGSGENGYFMNLVNKRPKDDLIYEALELTGLSAHKNDIAGALPFGTQRMIDLARASISRPKLLLLDEPASGLVVSEKKSFMAMVRLLAEKKGIKILIIEHDMNLVMEMASEIVVLDRGKVIAHGNPSEIVQDKLVLSAYLGVEATPDQN